VKTIRVSDQAVVLVMNKAEGTSLNNRLKQSTGVKESKLLLKVKEKLMAELGEI